MSQNGGTEASKTPNYQVRRALETDIAGISTIHAHYVLNTVLTFRYTPATSEQLLEEFRSVAKENLPYLVATDEASGAIVGYCYAARFRPPKLGYRPTVELSIYCSPEHTSRGVGSLLLTELVRILKEPVMDSDANEDGGRVKNVLACMAVDSSGPGEGLALKKFYELFGFEDVGRLRGVGYKFNRWVDTIYMQLSI